MIYHSKRKKINICDTCKNGFNGINGRFCNILNRYTEQNNYLVCENFKNEKS